MEIRYLCWKTPYYIKCAHTCLFAYVVCPASYTPHTHTHTHTHSIDPKAGYGKGKYGWTKWDVCVPQASILKSPFSFFGDVFVLQARHPLKSFSSDFDISIVNILGF